MNDVNLTITRSWIRSIYYLTHKTYPIGATKNELEKEYQKHLCTADCTHGALKCPRETAQRALHGLGGLPKAPWAGGGGGGGGQGRGGTI